jgi:hypothetical protein
MAKTIANCTMWVDDVQIASQVNQVSIQSTAAEADVTTFANAGMARLGGLKDGVISASGFWESNPDPDFSLFGDVGSLVPVTVALARNAPEGTTTYSMCAQIAQYGGIGAKVGNPLAFSLRCAQSTSDIGSGPVNNGRLAQGVLAVNRTASANFTSAIYQLPAPALLQGIVLAVHVSALTAGATLTVQLSSSASPSMSSPTVHDTSGFAPPSGSDVIQIAGPLTDIYWQISVGFTGTSPSATLAASIGNCY